MKTYENKAHNQIEADCATRVCNVKKNTWANVKSNKHDFKRG